MDTDNMKDMTHGVRYIQSGVTDTVDVKVMKQKKQNNIIYEHLRYDKT